MNTVVFPQEKLVALQKKIALYSVIEAKERYEASLLEFLQGAWSSLDNAPFQSCWAIDAMCDHMEAVAFGHIPRLLVNVPPRCSKTTLCSVVYPAWIWARTDVSFLSGPQVRFLCASYSHNLSLDSSNKSRRLLLSPWFQRHWPGKIVFQGDQNTKCLLRGTPILMADGTLRAIEEVRPGEKVLSYNLKEKKVVCDRVVHVWANGVKPARKLILTDGTYVTATHNHRFYGWDEWRFVGDMVPGDPIAVVERTPVQKEVLDLDDVFLVSVWLAEGTKQAYGYGFTNSDPLIIGRMRAIAKKRGWFLKHSSKYGYGLIAGKNKFENTPMAVLKHYLGSAPSTRKGRTKLKKQTTGAIRVPDLIMAGTDEVVREFLGAYIACDGCVVFPTTKGVSISTVSSKMILDLAFLFKRFGVQFRIRKSKNNTYVYKGVRRPTQVSWWIGVGARTEIQKLNQLYLYSKDAKFRRLLKWCSGKFRHMGSRSPSVPPHHLCSHWSTKRSSIAFAKKAQDNTLTKKLSGGLSWRAIREIEEVGAVETWHVQTEETSLFFANGVLSHNTQFDNTAGGSRIATSVGGSLLGIGGDTLIADDLNNTEQVESEAERENVANFWNEFHTTRLNDPKRSAIIAIQQRLHEQDVSGLILDSDEDWVHLCIPMRFDPTRKHYTVKLPQYEDDEPWTDPREVEDELMWPERFDDTIVRQLETSLGPYMAAGRLQQLPVPKGGGILKREWWQPWDGEEARRYGLEWSGERKDFPHFELVVGSLDTSYGEKQENDYNALTVWGIWIDRNKNRRAMLMFGWAKRLPLHGKVISAMPGEARVNFEQRQREGFGLIEWTADTCRRYKVQRLLIEDKTRGRDVANEINRLYARENWSPELINPVGDKVSRTHSVVPLFTDNAVWAPDTRWADAVIAQCQSFPKGAHDDLHDTVTMFLSWARGNGLLVRGDEMSAALEDEQAYKTPQNSIANQYGV